MEIKKIREKYRKDGIISLIKSVIQHTTSYIKYKIIESWLKIKGRKIIENRNILINVQKDKLTPYKKRLILNKYESSEAEFIENHLPPDKNVIELGGGIGFISCLINRKINSNKKHVVLEPNKEIIPILKENKELNNCDFKIEEKAYLPTSEKSNYHRSEEFLGGTTRKDKGKDREQIKIKSTNLEKICSKYDISEFGLVLDIEGEESSLINSELELLEEKCTMIIIEMHFSYPKIKEAKKKLDKSEFNLIDKKGSVFLYSK